MVIGYIIPSTVGSVLTIFTGESGSKIIRYILFIDPFQPFYESLIYVVLKHTFEVNEFNGWDEVANFFVYEPTFACIAMLTMAFVYFVIAVIIDSYLLNKYKNQDMKQP